MAVKSNKQTLEVQVQRLTIDRYTVLESTDKEIRKLLESGTDTFKLARRAYRVIKGDEQILLVSIVPTEKI